MGPRQRPRLAALSGSQPKAPGSAGGYLHKYVKESFGDEAGGEGRRQELERLLEEEIAAVEARFAEAMKAQEQKYAILRDSCLAPEDETANTVLRLEMALDRAIDRKVRILLTMRKEHARGGAVRSPHEKWCGRPARCGAGILPVPRRAGRPSDSGPGRPRR